ncbi:uncharacterized protein [Onthophagus taurus]|uniref:uncharacterized protein n=1 Tax=Onthophagus taurus TaxID=166361 RepID=UPI000C20758D|nr:uncharacterized protein LOC111429385 [Onthophagus taurus]XP_022921050.1 uncharacterized protein LOC111429385 [Onthophagus taurus]
MKRKFGDEMEVDENSSRLAEFYGLDHIKTQNSEHFTSKNLQLTKGWTNITLNYQIFIYNLPKKISQEELLLILLKSKALKDLKLIQVNHKVFGFIKFDENLIKLNDFIELLNNHEQVSGALNGLMARKCLQQKKTVYISNMKIKKSSFFKLQSSILNILIGLRRIHFYPIDKFGRFAIKLEVFEHFYTDLALELLTTDKRLFKNQPEVMLNTETNSAFLKSPVLIFEWNQDGESNIKRPIITVLNNFEVQKLAAF